MSREGDSCFLFFFFDHGVYVDPRNTAIPISPPPNPNEQNRLRNDLLDGVTSPQTNPLGDRTVLLLSFGKLLLGTETLLALVESINISDRRSENIRNIHNIVQEKKRREFLDIIGI